MRFRRRGEIRILIADDSERVRHAIRNLLSKHSNNWVVCGEVDNGEDAVEEVAKLLPDVILLDVSIPLSNGLAVAQLVKREHPTVAVVMMSEQDISVLTQLANAAGTRHYLMKSRIGFDLIPLLTSLVKDPRNPCRR